jgi:hypothetical protein
LLNRCSLNLLVNFAEIGASGVGDSVALEATGGLVRDRSFHKPCFDQGVEVAAHVSCLVAQPQPRQKVSASHLDIVEQGEDRDPMVIRVTNLATW